MNGNFYNHSHRTPLRNDGGFYTLVINTQPHNCGGNCLYCINTNGLNKSQIESEDSKLYKDSDWKPTHQLKRRLDTYGLKLKKGNKYNIIIHGGSFTNYERKYLETYIKDIYDFLNHKKSYNLEEAKFLQGKSSDSCSMLTVATRPDLIDEEWCDYLQKLGVTGVEIGVQSLNEEVLKINRRGHGIEATINATCLLKEYGLTVFYHIMVGLPGSSIDSDIETLSEKLWLSEFSPDHLKIFPCILLKETKFQTDLFDQIYKGWKPLSDELYMDILKQVKPHFPEYVHINRIQRIIDSKMISHGPSKKIDRFQFKGVCDCLWHRYIGHNIKNMDSDFSAFSIKVVKQGKGFFIQAVIEKNIVIGYIRVFLNLDKKIAVFRDLRVLGKMYPIGRKNILDGIQHQGVGKALIKYAESIAATNNCFHVMVNPSAGSRLYFESIGFNGENPMCKKDSQYNLSVLSKMIQSNLR